jgi:hypothetical protein
MYNDSYCRHGKTVVYKHCSLLQKTENGIFFTIELREESRPRAILTEN